MITAKSSQLVSIKTIDIAIRDHFVWFLSIFDIVLSIV